MQVLRLDVFKSHESLESCRKRISLRLVHIAHDIAETHLSPAFV
jgi:hypothetical protein